MNFRHELKHEINHMDMLSLRQRLKAVMTPDSHGQRGRYTVRSLYFDNIDDKALREKIKGLNHRKKFHMRYYDGDTSFIRLEKKSKYNSLSTKTSVPLTVKEAEALVSLSLDWMRDSSSPLIIELYSKMLSQGLRPKTIVEYTREAYTFGPGNVRVTLDYNIRTGLTSTDFINPRSLTVPAGGSPAILEVKWDNYLPDIIKDIIQLDSRRASAFSKYAACRIYG